MPWKENDAMENRRRFVMEATAEGASMTSLCKRYGISRPTGYKWLNRYLELGELARLEEHSRRPRSSPEKVSREVESKVVALRKEHGWGSRKLQKLLRAKQVVIAQSTVNRILRDHGLLREALRTPAATKRFERKAPNELVQIDFKGDLKLSRGVCYPLSLLDDHSRYVLGARAFLSQEGVGVERFVTKVFEEYGVPDSMLMDHGVPWWSSTSGYGLTKFSVFLIRQGVVLRYSGVGHPQTQGKIERYHRTMKEWFGHHGQSLRLKTLNQQLAEFLEEYNQRRPHEALDLEPPATRYKRSTRAFKPNPIPWEYPQGSDVYTVDANGSVYYNRQRRFVSHALEGRRVHCLRSHDQLLVSYRHMTIRQVDLKTGRSIPAVRPYGPTGHAEDH